MRNDTRGRTSLGGGGFRPKQTASERFEAHWGEEIFRMCKSFKADLRLIGSGSERGVYQNNFLLW